MVLGINWHTIGEGDEMTIVQHLSAQQADHTAVAALEDRYVV